MITDIDALVPEDHLLRKIERIMDYEWLYEWLDPYYNYEVGWPGPDPVVLIKMVLIQHLFGILSLRHTTTDREGKRTYQSTSGKSRNCPRWVACGANEKGQKLLTTHIWQEHLDLAEALRKTGRGKELYASRIEMIERVFAEATEKHALRYT